ncbi:LysR family transcriptional regulator, partial [Streptomyces sp. SID2119]|nr:LysR family transcriptional regulator [Streptomyces sp. SID2119]
LARRDGPGHPALPKLAALAREIVARHSAHQAPGRRPHQG